ncbi:MAG: ankyrin repeat domain-containing protein [Flavobacteriales bacterium]|nr:ankyrin repeat domain-containing protein [Flavobacteriales bacterium]
MNSLFSISRIYLIITGIAFTSLAKAQDIHSAVLKDDTLMVKEAIKNGADINARDKYGASPLMTAARWGNIPMVQFLLRNGATPDQPRSEAGRTALHVACAYYGGMQICKALIAAGADVNAVTQKGESPLMLAATNGKADVVELLLQRGADKQKKDNSGKTALDYARNAEVSDWTKNTNKDALIDKEKTIEILMR